MTKIQIFTRLHDGIYKSQGGGQTRMVASWNYGPRNLVKAYRFLLNERSDNKRYYGGIGAGRTWLQTDDGRVLDTFCLQYMPDMSDAALVDEIASWLKTPAEHARFAAAVDAQIDAKGV